MHSLGGGEIKFQELKEWIFDPFLKVTNTPWRETKTLQFYAMARVFDPNFWGFCFYFTFGSFVMCEGGLQRTIGQQEKGLMYKAFPRCHTVKDAGVSGIHTEGKWTFF